MVIDHDDADDVVQNTFIKVWKGLPFFREDAKLFSWIYRIAYNETVSFLKSKKRDLGLSANAFCDHLENIVDDNKSINCEELEVKLQKAILDLPKKQQMVFHLRYYDEMPYEEMSEVLGTSVGSLKASFHIAVKKIEKIMLDD